MEALQAAEQTAQHGTIDAVLQMLRSLTLADFGEIFIPTRCGFPASASRVEPERSVEDTVCNVDAADQ